MLLNSVTNIENNTVERYVNYHLQNAIQMEIDTHLDAAIFIANKLGMNLEQRYWFSFINACCETTPTALFVFKNFQNTPSITEFTDFYKKNKDNLKAQYDVRWIIYEWPKVFESYKNLILTNKSIDYSIRKAMKGDTEQERFNNFVKKFHIYKFGTYTFFLYTELLYYLCGVPMSVNLDFRTNHSVRNGLIYAIGEENKNGLYKKGEKLDEKYAKYLCFRFLEIKNKIQKLPIKARHKTLWSIETTLCTFNKYNHGKRYLGFYCERQRKEIMFYQEKMNQNEDLLWEYRKNVFPRQNLNELKGIKL